MNKNDKELDQICTTDKLKAIKALKDAGYKAEFNTSGVPTVVCASAADIDSMLKKVRKILKDLRYNGSFGVRGPRKTDQVMPEGSVTESVETPENVEGDESTENAENAIPA